MTEKMRQMTIKIPESAYLKLKVMGLMRKQSMTAVVLELIENCDRLMPSDPVAEKRIYEALKNVWASTPKPAAVEQDKSRRLLVSKIVKLRKSGSTYQEIADALQNEEVPTLSGRGKWHKQAVHKLLRERGLI